MTSEAYTAMATYLVRPERVAEVGGLLRRHWPVLRDRGLVTSRPGVVYSGEGEAGPFFVEFVEWVDGEATGRAFRDEWVNPIWQDLFAFTEGRNGRPAIEYPTVVRQEHATTTTGG